MAAGTVRGTIEVWRDAERDAIVSRMQIGTFSDKHIMPLELVAASRRPFLDVLTESWHASLRRIQRNKKWWKM